MALNWKLIGVLATIAGAGLSLVSSKVEEEKMKAEVKRTVEEALAEREEESE